MESDAKKDLAAARQEWEATALKKALEIKTERQPEFKTVSGIPLERVYSPADQEAAGFDYVQDLGFPGGYPYTRGIDPLGYRDQLWVMGQYSGYGTAKETNQRFKYLLEQGQTGFSIALDLPTQMGYDADHPMAEGEVGQVGVSISSLADFEELMEGIPLEKVRQIRTTANANGPIITAMFIAMAEKRGMSPNDFSVLLQNDPLKEYMARGAYIFPPGPAVKLSADVIEYVAKNLPRWNPIMICGYHIRESGGTAIQEVAYAMSNAIAYIDATRSRGLDVGKFAPSFYFFTYLGIDFMEEVAKIRAVRRIWARLLDERYGFKSAYGSGMPVHSFIGGSALTAQQPMNNIVRVTIAAMAAVAAGVQTMATASYDEALSIPSEEASRVALRTQQIIAYESGLTSTVDPLGGSYLLETLTGKIEAEVKQEMQKVEERGGVIECLSNGYIQEEITTPAYRYQKELETGQRTMVGVNKFKITEETRIKPFRQPAGMEQEQVERVKKLKRSRDNTQVQATLNRVREAARSGENMVEPCLEAVRAYATMGEICDVLREVWGEYKQAGAKMV